MYIFIDLLAPCCSDVHSLLYDGCIQFTIVECSLAMIDSEFRLTQLGIIYIFEREAKSSDEWYKK